MRGGGGHPPVGDAGQGDERGHDRDDVAPAVMQLLSLLSGRPARPLHMALILEIVLLFKAYLVKTPL